MAEDEAKKAEETEAGEGQSPEPNFLVFISGLAAQVLMSLGEIENPVTKEKKKDLRTAKYSIDLIDMLRTRTEGNRSADETKYLDAVLYDLRMRFVKASGG